MGAKTMQPATESPRRVVVVTGASAGVGRATVRAFAERGDAIGLIARGRDGLLAAAREVVARGSRACVVECDVANAADVDAAASAIERELGPIDVWVNNAMVSVLSPVKELEPADVQRVTEVTYLGAVYGTMSALRRMHSRDRGVIIQVGSALAYRAIPLQAAYCGAKHALRGFSDALRSELIHDRSRVRVAMAHLPAIDTPQFDWMKSRMPKKAQPVPPIFAPEVAAEAIVWLASHPRRELYVGLSAWKAIVGNKLVPGLLDRYLAKRGYDGQMTDEPESANRPDNLWAPLSGDAGAHGRFGARAKRRSPETWMAKRRAPIGALLMTAGLALAVGAYAARR
jgi:NAD(P)-dependent dehydrogenase (short-subunit alcohol dehydrogenase family)